MVSVEKFVSEKVKEYSDLIAIKKGKSNVSCSYGSDDTRVTIIGYNAKDFAKKVNAHLSVDLEDLDNYIEVRLTAELSDSKKCETFKVRL